MANESHIDGLLNKGRLIICAGPGGVGKTTTSAALALRAAQNGKNAIVLTIDPARRLADSLGLEELTNDPQRIETGQEDSGELWAMMLDQQQTLDDLVAKYAPDDGALKRSRENNVYKLLSTALHGMQEYMALDKLHDLYTSGKYDLVVLDTPPTKNALEFLETPGRARQFFDERIIKWFLPATKKAGFLRRVVNPSSIVTTLLAKIFGQVFVDDLLEFFDTLSFLQEALKHRGEMIDMILRDEQTHFVVITSADKRRIDEAIFFHKKLADLNQKASAFILNRVIPSFRRADLDTASLKNFDDDVAAEMRAHYGELADISTHSDALIEDFEKRVKRPIIRVELLREDIHDVSQLGKMGAYLAESA